MTATTIETPHIAPELIEAEDARRIARDELIATLRKLQERNRQRFLQAGGCTRCNSSGRLSASFSEDGLIVTEDAGPCPGWAIGMQLFPIFGRFPDCNAKTEQSPDRLVLVVVEAAPCTVGVVAPYTDRVEAMPEADQRELADANENVAIAEETERAVRRRFTPHIGARVLVVAGRKIKKGSTGEIMWRGFADRTYGDSRWRAHEAEVRLGVLVDGQDALTYTAEHNVRVVEPSPDIDCPELYGSDKQVAWARKLRVHAMRNGMTHNEASAHDSARWWIDQYGSTGGQVRRVAEKAGV